MRVFRLIFFSFLLFCGSVFAQESDSLHLASHKNFLKVLATPDSVTQAVVVLHHDVRINKLLDYSNSSAWQHQKGFRVQLFSSNATRSAKEAAFNVEKRVLQKFPDIDIYVTYSAPFWKVRVGNCFSHEEAIDLRNFLSNEFPEFQSEMYIVPDQIIVN